MLLWWFSVAFGGLVLLRFSVALVVYCCFGGLVLLLVV